PPTVIAKFVELHAACLQDFRVSQTSLQTAMRTNSKHELKSDNDATPPAVANNLKLPTTQIIKAASRAENDPRVVTAREAAEKDIATASVTATAYLSMLYSVQVEVCQELVSVTTVADDFATSLETYSHSIIKGGGGTDLTVWDAVIAELEDAMKLELQNMNYEFVAVLERDTDTKSKKADAVKTARAAADLVEVTKPVQELINEGIQATRNGEGFRRRKRKHRKHASRALEGETEIKEGQVERRTLNDDSLRLHDVTSWVSPSDERFHHHRPDTYPEMFFAADLPLQTRFVVSKMSELYCDTRLKNRSFHNFSDVPLNHDQIKLLALNSKF
ncbi:hypothetical protein DFH07DRAFT_699985, partial [Mycena maculata]